MEMAYGVSLFGILLCREHVPQLTSSESLLGEFARSLDSASRNAQLAIQNIRILKAKPVSSEASVSFLRPFLPR